MDNQQETFRHYIAGLFEGEGSLYIGKVMIYGKQISYRGQVQFTNTEPEICQAFVDYLKLKGYCHHIRKDVRKNRKTCYQIMITKRQHKIAFLDEFIPLFLGKKKQEAELIKQLLVLIDSNVTNKPLVNTKGKYEKTTDRFPEYEKLYQECKNLKRSSETTCDTPTLVG
jgi:hypothetical protein